MPQQTASSAVPPIRSFQFDASAAGSVKDSVNLSRGDVNLKQSLFTMPGRGGDATDVEISLLYQSNVHSQAMTFNRQAPTGVVGLGWSFPDNRIELQGGSGSSPASRSYALVSNGGTNPLAREPGQPFLFALTDAQAGSPEAGQLVPSALVCAFGQRGLALSASATLAAQDEGALRLIDDPQQRDFMLVPQSGGWRVFDGGQSYQLEQYDFSKILYYPQWERWVIIDASGAVRSYGGAAASGDTAFSASVGNSVEWAVAWTSGAGEAMWIGASSQASGQCQIARAWHLASTTNLWGDQVRYAYNEQWPLDPQTGIRPVVEQLVCMGGKPYTKACYLTSVTDAFGRQAIFSYGDKLWSSQSGQPREYDDPHKAVPDNMANGWQDCYETQFLDSIVVNDADGGRLFGVDLAYAPRQGQGPADAVANVNLSPADGDPADYYKRYLTAITFTNEFGQALPPIQLGYYLDQTQGGGDDGGYSPGALAYMTSPGGAVSRWSYQRRELALCNRTLTVTPPQGFDGAVMPRAWFGDDYAVTMWVDVLGNRLSLQIQTWQGRWEVWTPSWGDVLATEPGGIDLKSFAVDAGADFVVVSYVSGASSTEGAARKVYVFDKDPEVTGNWLPATIASVTCGQDTPCLSYTVAYGSATLAAGDTFFLVNYMSSLDGGACDRLTWRWSTRAWSRETQALGGAVQLAARAEYYLALAADGSYVLNYLDAALNWRTGGGGRLDGFIPLPQEYTALVPGSSTLVVGQLLSTGSNITYGVNIIQWDASYRATVHSSQQSDSNQVSWVPQLVNDTMVAVGGRVWRFDGSSWLLNESLVIQFPTEGWNQRYAYGPDYAIQLYVDGSNRLGPDGAKLLAYDATKSVEWGAVPPVVCTQPVGQNDAWPTAGEGDFLTIGSLLYYRGSAADWAPVVAAGAGQNLGSLIAAGEALQSSATVNQGPAFIAFNTKDVNTGQWTSTAAMVLDNGVAVAEEDMGTGLRMASSDDPDHGLSGVVPAGPSTLVLFPDTDASFSQSRSFTLYRYAGNELDGRILHYGVSSFSVDDGFGNPVVSAIVLDPSTAACDPGGTYIKYYDALVAPGASSVVIDARTSLPAAGSVPNGFVKVRYLNGVAQVVGQENAPSAFDGMLSSVAAYDAGLEQLSQVTLAWQSWQSVAGDPADSGMPNRWLRGGFALQRSASLLLDGVHSSRTSSYVAAGFSAPFSTQATVTSSTGIGTSGLQETQTTRNTFAISLDDSITQGVFRTLNIRGATVQVSNEWQAVGAAGLTTSATASTWQLWASQLGASVQVPAEEASFSWLGRQSLPAFPFGSYEPGVPVDGWQRQSSISSRTVHGLGAQGKDAVGVVSSAIFDKTGTVMVASLVNGSYENQEWTYLGFEDYEDRAGWTLDGAGDSPGDAYFGTRSVVLPAGASLATQVNVRDGSTSYVLGYAIKTAPGAAPSTGTAWTLSFPGSGAAPVSVPVASTDGSWQFRTLGIPLAAVPSGAQIRAELASQEAAGLLVDCIYLIPLGANFSAQCYDMRYGQAISAMTMTGMLTRSLYDDFRHVVAAMDGDGVLRQYGGQAMSRANSADGQFAPAAPNATLKVVFADYGLCDDFYRGSEWTARWEAGNSGNWTQSPGLLSTEGASLRWKGNAAGLASAALCVGLQGQPGQQVDLNFADGYLISWQPGNGWVASGPDWTPHPLVQPPAMAGEWLLVFGEGLLAFFAGSQLVFSRPWTSGVPDDISLVAHGSLSLCHIGVGGGPRLNVSYTSGSDQPLQGQTLAGCDAAVSSTINDLFGRSLAATKCAPASYCKPADLPLLAYLDGFVDRQAFLAATHDSWVMTGAVADYYSGKPVDGYTPSDDQGYPYVGARYAAAPKGRKLETGLPGLDTAIHDVSLPPSTRHTTWYQYGCNPASSIHGTAVAAGSYYEQVMTGPLGNATRRWRTFNRTQVAAQLLDTSADVASQTATLQQWQAADGLVAGVSKGFTPNHFTGDTGFVNTQYDNALGQQVMAESSGMARNWSVRDAAGRVRVTGIGESAKVAYFVYDALGRPVEFGLIELERGAQAAALARNPSWPLSDPARIATRTYAYDGDGNDRCMLGMRRQVVTTTSAPVNVAPQSAPVSVCESFAYDGRGLVVGMTQSFPDQVELPSATFEYAYDNADEVLMVRYPAGAPIAQVHYRYDDNGRVTGIGTASGLGDLAVYAYAPNGDLISETLGGGVLALRSTFNSQGWLAQYTASLGGAPVFWSQNYNYLPDSTVRDRTDTTAAPLPAGVTLNTFTYDGIKQLGSAVATGAVPWSETVTGCDVNGNILAASFNTSAMTATRDPQSNRLLQVQLGSAPAMIAGYDELGNLTSIGSTVTDYDPLLQQASGFSGSGGTAQIAYGSANQRLLKRALVGASGADQLYFGGISTRPLAQWKDGIWSAAVFGPTGLVAIASDGLRFPVKDNLQSVRHLVDGQGNVKASFTYSAYGSLVAQSGEVDASLPRFMGQLQDVETGCYAFPARLYDPVLRRFHAPDPARQFPSPYVFVGNQPISNTDPTGEMAWYGLMAMSAVFAVGFGLSLCTGGTSDLAVAEIDGMLLAGEVSEATGDSVDTALVGEKSVGDAAKDAGKSGDKVAGGSQEVESGISEPPVEDAAPGEQAPAEGKQEAGQAGSSAGAQRAAAVTRRNRRNALRGVQHIAARGFGGMVTSASENGALYLLENPDASIDGNFWKTFCIGALEGAISGSLASLVDMPISKGLMRKNGITSPALQSAMVIAGKGVVGVGCSDANYLITDAVQGKAPTALGWAYSNVWGGLASAGSSALGEGFSHLSSGKQGLIISAGAVLGVCAEASMLGLGEMQNQ